MPSRPAGRTAGFVTRTTHALGGEARAAARPRPRSASASSRSYARASETSCTARATVAVVDGVLEPVGDAALADVELDVEEEVLAVLALVRVDAVAAEERAGRAARR